MKVFCANAFRVQWDRKVQLPLCLLFALFLAMPYLGNTQTMALQVVGSAGGLSETSMGSLHWTAGECVVSEKSNGNVLPQGFHQIIVYYIVPTEAPDAPVFTVKAYPNPTADWLNVEAAQAVQLTLFNLVGKTVLTAPKAGLNHQLDLSILPTGTYLLRISDEKGVPLKTIRVQHIF